MCMWLACDVHVNKFLLCFLLQITELVHQRDTTRMLITNKVSHTRRFEWLSQMRFYFDPKKSDVLQQLSIHMANAQFNYGFEYLGVQDKLVQTPLTDRCYLTMTQALEERLGGSPFGELMFVFSCNVCCLFMELFVCLLLSVYRACRYWQDRVSEGSWPPAGEVCSGLQL